MKTMYLNRAMAIILTIISIHNFKVSSQPEIEKNNKSAKGRYEIKIYYSAFQVFEEAWFGESPKEGVGLSFEFPVKENLSLEIGATLNNHDYSYETYFMQDQVNEGTLYVNDFIERNKIINFNIKKYVMDDGRVNLYYGGYLRYWNYKWEMINLGSYDRQYLDFLRENETRIGSYSHKVSLGVILGFKYNIGNTPVTIGANGGGGLSPRFLYWGTKDYMDNAFDKSGNWEDYSSLSHLSLRCELTVGYRF